MKLKIIEQLSPSQIAELINYSISDELIKRTTTDNIRFKDEEAYELWRAKKRKVYALIDENEKLKGITWFGKKDFPKNIKMERNIEKSDFNITFAIRIYSDLRGKGYALSFMKESYKKFTQTNDYKNNPKKGFWLLVNSNNIPAIKTYRNFGFKEILAETGNDRKVMLYK